MHSRLVTILVLTICQPSWADCLKKCGSGGEIVTESKLASENYGDFTCGASVDDCLINANAVELGTDTTGNYAAGDGEAGAATSGDSATGFFSTGTIEEARLPTTILLESEACSATQGTGNPPATCTVCSFYAQTATTIRNCYCHATNTWQCSTATAP